MLSLDFLQATEEAALACAPWIGASNEHAADQAAVDAMRRVLNSLPIDGTVVIGEGEIDEAPMLYIGEKVGTGGTKVDIAVDPLEGTKITAKGKMNAMSVLAVANDGCFLHAPDCYMEKIVTGPLGKGLIDLNLSATENIKKFAKTKYCSPKEITIALLNRPRHAKLMKEIDKLGAKIHLIDDGDILAGIATCLENNRVDMLMGIGGAPEGVLTAAAVKCMGGYMQARLVIDTPELLERTQKMGIQDSKKIYTLNELAAGDVAFFATGVTDGYFLKGTLNKNTHSVVMHSGGLVRFVSRSYGEKT
jgi:fructose-1,6-bisphosphatase II